MTLPEKIFALRRLPVLAGLTDPELAVLAEAARERRYAPGAVVCAAGRLPGRLAFVCAGVVQYSAGRDRGAAPGAAALLFDRPDALALVAGAGAGALCLQVPRSHLFTLVRQCPAFVVSLLAAAPAAASPP
jgi:hypothetical protein